MKRIQFTLTPTEELLLHDLMKKENISQDQLLKQMLTRITNHYDTYRRWKP